MEQPSPKQLISLATMLHWENEGFSTASDKTDEQAVTA